MTEKKTCLQCKWCPDFDNPIYSHCDHYRWHCVSKCLKPCALPKGVTMPTIQLSGRVVYKFSESWNEPEFNDIMYKDGGGQKLADARFDDFCPVFKEKETSSGNK